MSESRSRYETLVRIAVGGMGTVFAGRARGAVGFTRLVAIKRPHPFVASDPELRGQLEREARVASMIHHPNVVSVLDVEEIDGELSLVLDYVEGCALGELVAHADESAVAFTRIALRVVLDAAAGLAAAHGVKDDAGRSRGIVHRDVSPHNVLVGTDGSARLADFGIAKITAADGQHTSTGVLKGKLAYMPPEYLEHRRYDARSDLFSLGVVAWEALTRQRLFKGATEIETIKRIVEGRAPALSSVRAELAPLDAVFARALAPSPDERPPSVDAFAEELERVARDLGWVASPREVGAFVERIAGGAIAARRRLLDIASRASRDAIDVDVSVDPGDGGAAPPASARDDVVTSSMPAAPGRETASGASSPSARSTVTGRSRRGIGLLGSAGGAALVVITAIVVVRASARRSAGDVSVPSAVASSTASAAPLIASGVPVESATEGSTDMATSLTSATPGAATSARPHVRPRSRPLPSAVSAPSKAPPNPYAR